MRRGFFGVFGARGSCFSGLQLLSCATPVGCPFLRLRVTLVVVICSLTYVSCDRHARAYSSRLSRGSVAFGAAVTVVVVGGAVVACVAGGGVVAVAINRLGHWFSAHS